MGGDPLVLDQGGAQILKDFSRCFVICHNLALIQIIAKVKESGEVSDNRVVSSKHLPLNLCQREFTSYVFSDLPETSMYGARVDDS